MTLLDFPGRVACTVFLGGCDLRCPFCHNFDLATGNAPALMTDDELLSFLNKRKGLLEGVAITGGEPCLRPDLPELLKKIKDMGYGVKLDTNGTHPALLRAIIEGGLLDYVAMDVKNSPAKYAVTCGVERVDMDAIRQSIGLLMSGKTDYEFRTTVVKEYHEAADFAEIGQMIRGAKRYFLQCFTDRDTVPKRTLHAPTAEELRQYAHIARSFVPDTQLRGVD
jgi:pyruvate formate lyase activating enzyme